ncbi:unnamed protein product [Boreogadus saida]
MRFCICGGCSNSDLLSDHLRFHSFHDRRKDGAGFRAWVHFVQTRGLCFRGHDGVQDGFSERETSEAESRCGSLNSCRSSRSFGLSHRRQ